jgi:large subunit ribosomal protein L25
MKFTAYERTLQGTGASRRLRNAAKVPGIVYGAGTPTMIELDHNALFFALKKEAFHSSILEMDLAGKTEKVLLRDFQMHAWKPIVLHVDFQRVDETTKLRKKVPLHFVRAKRTRRRSRPTSAWSTTWRTDLEIECLASQLPEFVTIDLSGLVKNQSLHASDLKLPEGIKAVKHGTLNPVIVAVTVPKAEEEVAPPCPWWLPRAWQGQGQEGREAEQEVIVARPAGRRKPHAPHRGPPKRGPFLCAFCGAARGGPAAAAHNPAHDSTLRRPGQPGH